LRIKILGDCYNCVSGMPDPDGNHAKNGIEMGLKMIEIIKKIRYIMIIYIPNLDNVEM